MNLKNHRINEFWPVLVASIFLLALVSISYFRVLEINSGHFGYVIDDVYIMMAMAKNLALHGVYGVSPFETVSANSSIIYVFIFAILMKIFGVNEIIPLFLSLFLSIILFIFIFLFMKREGVNQIIIFFVLVFVTLLSPLVFLIFEGMEPIFQMIITLGLVYFGVNAITTEGDEIRENFWLFLCAILLPLVRYEGLILVLLVTGILLLKRKFKIGLLTLTFSVIPVIIFGTISVISGQFFIPNSIIMKSGVYSSFFSEILTNILNSPHIIYLHYPELFLMLFFCVAILLCRLSIEKTIWNRLNLYLILFIGITLLHLFIAKTGGFYRYEAYLYMLGCVVLGTALSFLFQEWNKSRDLPDDSTAEEKSGGIFRNDKVIYLLCGIFLILSLAFIIIPPQIPIGLRATESILLVPIASNNNYEQQYQMGLFVKEFYNGEGVVANDIGELTWIADIRLFDAQGLGSTAIAHAYITNKTTSSTVLKYAEEKGAKIAIIYDIYKIPPSWRLVGDWKIPNNVICAFDHVYIYSIDPSDTDHLIQSLKSFSKQMPQDILQKGVYLS